MLLKCPYIGITCLQGCGCCKDCKKANEYKHMAPDCACGIWRNHRHDNLDKNMKGELPPEEDLPTMEELSDIFIADTKRHLCDTCTHEQPNCPATPEDVAYGDGFGNDNVIGCRQFSDTKNGDKI